MRQPWGRHARSHARSHACWLPLAGVPYLLAAVAGVRPVGTMFALGGAACGCTVQHQLQAGFWMLRGDRNEKKLAVRTAAAAACSTAAWRMHEHERVTQ